MKIFALILIGFFCGIIRCEAERINHEGRILGTPPSFTNAVLFNTPEADAIVSTLQIFPRDNAWNEDVSNRPSLANSAAMIAQISADLATNRQTLQPFYEMNFALVPDAQPLVPIAFEDYPDESDPSPYPIPTNLPVEQWPRGTGSLSLFDWQRDITGDGGDRHSIIVQPSSGNIWETWQSLLVVSGSQTNWHASNGAKFSLTNNLLRPLGWTSGDAAGLSMFAGLVRYDECERGMVEHALRLVVKRTRKQYIYPATHYASSTSATQTNVPAMGQRLRLPVDFLISTNWTTEEKAVLRALKKYGAIVADNGGFFSISVTPDQRFSSNAFNHLFSINLTNFEVIQTTVATNGPRSPGAPLANAGADQTIALGNAATLSGTILYTNATPLVTQWRLYSGPTNVVFADSTLTNTVAAFSAAGTYKLMLSASDGMHTTVYDAVIINVIATIDLRISRDGNSITLQWSGGNPPYQVQQADQFPTTNWISWLTTSGNSISLTANTNNAFYRVIGQ